MGIRETPYPCFLAYCDGCGASTWPVAHSKTETRAIAEKDHRYVFMRDADLNEICYCPTCAKKISP